MLPRLPSFSASQVMAPMVPGMNRERCESRGDRAATRLAARPPRLSHRFLFISGTIGAITWLALNEEQPGNIRHGLVLANLGDPGGLHYKRSRHDTAPVDRAAAHVLAPRRRARRGRALSSPTATTSGSMARPALTCRSAACPRTPGGRSPGVPRLGRQPRPSDARGAGRHPCEACLEAISRHPRSATAAYRNLSPGASRSSAAAGCMTPSAARSDAKAPREKALLWLLNQSGRQPQPARHRRPRRPRLRAVADAAEALLAHHLLAPAA